MKPWLAWLCGLSVARRLFAPLSPTAAPRRGLRLAAVLLPLLLLVIAPRPAAADDFLKTMVVDSAGSVGQHTSLALDAAGYPRISYFDDTNDDLKYAAWNGSSWAITTVDSIGSVGWNPSLALDAAGHPRISYYDQTNFDLKYAAWNGASWTLSTVDSVGNVGQYTSLALDAAGNPRISYLDFTNVNLKYAAWNGSSWALSTVDNSAGSVGFDTSLALNAAGHPRISYHDASNADLKYAAWNGSSWTLSTVDNSAGNVGHDTSLALDAAGNPRISYLDFDNFDLKYAAWNGSSWTLTTVDSAGNVGSYTSLALDAAGNPRISYHDGTNANLKVAAWNGSSWTRATLDSAGNVGQDTSLALDAAGNPHISYYDSTNGDLKYKGPPAAGDSLTIVKSVNGGPTDTWSFGFTGNLGAFTLTTADPDVAFANLAAGSYSFSETADANYDTAIACDNGDDSANGSITVTLAANDQVVCAVTNTFHWQAATVDSAGEVGFDTSLKLDAAGNPRISYYDGTNENLKYAAWNGSSWAISTVVSAGTVGQYTSLALNAAGNPRISYYDNTNADLKYAAWNGSSWTISTVDSAGFVGQYTSLALDAAGNPRISYYDNTNLDLKYAAWNGSSWTLSTVDNSAGDVGSYTSLALDAAGNPRISYYDDTNDNLKYAAWNGSSWALSTVDSAGNVGASTSLVLNAAGNPRISYYDDTNDNLKYAAWNGVSWTISTVDSVGSVGRDTSLALDAAGHPRISYYDGTNLDLKYAAWNGSSWTRSTLDSVGNVGQFTSLALDAGGNPHISYYDVTNTNLKYITLPGESSELTIVKSVNGGPGGWSFDFTGDLGAFTLTNADPDTVFATLNAGSYSFSETADANYDTTIACNNGDSSAGGSITVDLGSGDAVVCTVTNTYDPPDTTPPDTTITGNPPNPSNSASATFTFSSTEPGGSFTCQLDSGTAAACASPQNYTDLSDGSHTFTVFATDAAGNPDPSPASHTWTIDTTGPTATITAAPSDPSNDATPTFEFSSETGATFECRVDGGAFVACVTPLTLDPLADGPHTFDVRATDTLGNTGAADSHSWTIDTTGPVVTIDVAPSDPSNDATPAFEFSSETGATFECRVDGGAFVACASPLTLDPLADGPHTFDVRATDALGNNGAADSHSWTIDTTGPVVTIDVAPSDPSNDATPTFEFSSESGATFECRVDGGAFVACAGPLTLDPLADGPHTFDVRATDTLGNTGAADSHTWTIDTTGPVVTIDVAPSDPSNDATPAFEFSSETGATFECSVDGGAFVACAGPLTLDPLADGPHTFDVRATDTLGNTGAADSHTWTIDTTGPVVTIAVAPSDPSNDATPAFEFSSESGATFECRVDGGAFVACVSPLTLDPLTDGPHTFDVRATDTLGNTGAADSHSWTIDTAAPTATITAAPPALTNNNDPSFEFSSESGATFTCQLDGGTAAACASPQAYTDLSDGSHTFAVYATDAAGNIGPADSHTWTIDTIGPDTTINSGPSGITGDNDPSFGFSSETGVTFECQLDSAPFAACVSPQPYTDLSDGPHTFRVRATDAAGNTGPTAERAFTVDSAAPSVSIDTHPPALTNSADATFTFSGEGGATFECRLDTSPFDECTSPISFPGLADGEHTFTVRATDAAGNSAEAAYTWTIDTTPPDTTITAAPDDPTNSNAASFSFSSTEPGGGFTCQLDSQPAAACTSPQAYTGLSDGPHTFTVFATDAAGNADASPATDTWTIDTAAPTVTINQASGQADPTGSSPINFTVEFSEAVTGFATGDVTLSGSAGATTAVVSGSGATYNVAVSGMTTSGTVVATIAAAVAEDAAGNDNAASTSTDNTVTYNAPDTTPPTVTINQASGQSDPTSAGPINFTVVFSEPVTGFATGDVTLSGSAGATTAVVSGSGVTYNVAVSGMTGSGTVIATIAANVAEDAAGNDNTASTSTDNTVTYNAPDTTPPTVTINQASGQADPTGSSPINFTVVFSEPVSGFATGDVTLSGSAGATTAVVSGSGATYNVAVSGMTGSGTVIASVAAAVADDAAGNDNAASTSTDNQVTYNVPAPAGAIYVTAAGGSVPGAGAYQKNDILKWNGSAWSVWFDGASEGLPAAADIMAFDVANEATGAAWIAIRQAVKLPGIGKTQPTQIAYTNGASWSLFFDGGDVGLKTTGERINGLEVLPGNVSPIGSGCLYYLLISTVAGGGVPIGPTNVNFTGEDVLGFCMTQSGANTAGTWHVVFEGQSEGLQKNNNYGVSASDDADTLYFTAKSNFTGDGGLVKPSELFSWSGGVFSGPLWKAKDHGLNQVVDGIDVVGEIP